MRQPDLPKNYVGLDKDINGGMTMIGKIIRDAWVFGILPETETCEGWTMSRLDALNHQVNDEWDKYSCMVSNLPPEILERHQRIHGEAIKLAKQAGFDGVEVHGANGYLLDQFLQTSTNQRTDDYGGSLENRARLMLAVTDAVVSVWGPGRVGMHLAPRCDAHDMGDDNPAATFGYVAEELGRRKIAFICTREHFSAPALTPALKKAFGGCLIANEQFTRESAGRALEEGTADAVAFGRAYIANPDLVERFKRDTPLNELDVETLYGGGSKGYTDYPVLEV